MNTATCEQTWLPSWGSFVDFMGETVPCDITTKAFVPIARTVHVNRPTMSRYQALTEKAEALQQAALSCAENEKYAMRDVWLWKTLRLVEARNELTTLEATEEVRK